MDLSLGHRLAQKVQQKQLALPAVGVISAMEMIRQSLQQKEK